MTGQLRLPPSGNVNLLAPRLDLSLRQDHRKAGPGGGVNLFSRGPRVRRPLLLALRGLWLPRRALLLAPLRGRRDVARLRADLLGRLLVEVELVRRRPADGHQGLERRVGHALLEVADR